MAQSVRLPDILVKQAKVVGEVMSRGERKKGDLDFLRVHKFKLSDQEALLGYMFAEDEIILTLLKLGTHENFYRDIQNSV